MGLALLVLGLALIAAAAWLAAASVRLQSLLDFALAFYLFLYGGVIAVVLALSPFRLVTRPGIIAASAVALAVSAAVWQWRGRPAAPSLRAGAAAAGAALRDPAVAVLTVAVALSLAYAATLAIALPLNDFDVLYYHMARAAIWAQDHGVHYIDHANTSRFNENPPGAETLSTWAMTLEGSDRFAGSFQVAALAATMVAILRIARHAGFGHREAAFGALLFATLPVVALHAATGGNDLVFTSFVLAAAAFMLQETRTSLALGGLALTLAVVTKGAVIFAIPLLLVVAVVLVPRRRWLSVAVTGAVSLAIGALWYLYHYVEAEGAAGHEQRTVLERGGRLQETPLFLWRLAIETVDPAGSVGRDRYAYAVVALVVVAVAGIVALRRRSRAIAAAGGIAAALLLVAVSFESVHDLLRRMYERALAGRVEERLVYLGEFREPTVPTAFTSWYGPLGLIAFLMATVLAIRGVRRGALRRGTLVLVLAPLVTLVIVATAWGYSAWHGRFLMPAVALSATTWGLMLRMRAVAWGLIAVALVTLCLSFLHYREKPAGISLLEGTTARSAWTADRLTVFSTWAPESAPEVQLIKRLGELVEDGQTVALRIASDKVTYPYFDQDLDRRVVFSGPDAPPEEADWLVVGPGERVSICPTGWRAVDTGGEDWKLYRRVGRCPDESASS